MRDIAGQLRQFSFQSLSQGVSDPNFGSDVEKIFLRSWQHELNAADQSVKPKPLQLLTGGIESAVPQALNQNGNEHLGASYSRVGQLGQIQDDLPLPAGAAFGFSFSLDTIVDRLNLAWQLLIGSSGPDFGRVGISGPTQGMHDPTSPLELQSIAIFGTGDQRGWTVGITGLFHTPTALPNIPVRVSVVERIGVGFTHSATSSVEVSSSDFKNAVTALEVIGAVAVLIPFAGAFGVPLSAFISGDIDQVIESKLAAAVFPAFSLLSMTVNAFPIDVNLPGTVDRLVFPYDAVIVPATMPNANSDGLGVIATMDPTTFDLKPAMSASAITAFGFAAPHRAAQFANTGIFGPASVLFSVIQAAPLKYAQSEVLAFTAAGSPGVQNPTFKWNISDESGKPTNSATMTASGATAQVTCFSKELVQDQTITVVLHVQMDDDLHLKDGNGFQPFARHPITLRLGPRPTPPVHRPPVILGSNALMVAK